METYKLEVVPEVPAAAAKKIKDLFTVKAEQGGIGKAAAFASTFNAVGGAGAVGAEATGAGGAAAAAAGGPMAVLVIAKTVFTKIASFAAETLAVVSGFVATSNPGLVERLGVAFADISGVIGQTLEPVIEALIPMVQDFGDFIASILPSQAEMNSILAEMKPLWADIVTIMRLLAPTLRDMVSALVDAVKWVVRVMAWLGKASLVPALEGAALNNEINKAMGGRAGEGGFERSSRGASSGHARFTGIGDLGRNLQLAAASLGLSAANRTADATENIDKKMDQLNRQFNDSGFISGGSWE